MTQNKTYPELFLVDGSGFIFRAYYALPPLNRPDGTPVNAVLGFVNMLVKLLAEFKAADVAVIFDAARLNYRNDIYPAYKANRAETPADLIPQFPLIRQATEAFNIPALELEGYEADDLIATYVQAARARGQHVTIVSSDKDLMQLVGDGVDMLDPIKYQRLQRDAVVEKFGVPPELVVDVQALAGDAVDNVPGVPGIGVKTAAQLILEYGDLEKLLAAAHSIKQPKRRELLTQYADQARISKQLVQLHQSVPVLRALDTLVIQPYDPVILASFLNEQGFRSVINRLRLDGDTNRAPANEISRASPEAVPVVPAQPLPLMPTDYECVQTMTALTAWIEKIEQVGIVAIDTETDSLQAVTANMVGLSLAIEYHGKIQACYVPLQHGLLHAGGGFNFDAAALPQIKLADAMAALKPVLENPVILKIGHNMKFDWLVFAQHNILVAPFDDTMVMSYALDGTAHGHGMDELAELFLGHKTIAFTDVVGTGKNQITFDAVPLDKATDYAAEDAAVTLLLWHSLKPRLVAEHCVALYEQIDRPFVGIIAEMERNGVLVDGGQLQKLGVEFGTAIAVLEKDIIAMAGRDFNIASPKQLGEILFDDLKLPGGVRGKNGAYSTSADVLETLAGQGHAIATHLMEYRQWQKLKSTYTDTLAQQINPKTGRVHTSYMLASTNTGRLSSTDPNLQNIPIRTEQGRRIRHAFIAAPHHVLMAADYSQIELRLLAALAPVPALQQAFVDGVDVHALTASEVFHVKLADVTADLRRNAKAVNFGIIYGISAWGLAQQLGYGASEASAIIARYYTRFPELKEFMERNKAEARQYNFVKTLWGRKCVIVGANDKNGARRAYAERQAINAPLQGTAADIMKRGMIAVHHALRDAGFMPRVKMLLQVHDELVLEVPADDLAFIQQVKETVQNAMEHAGRDKLSVPLVVDIDTASHWG